ncbi:MAG: undecaprenyl/decaprenyl-phosphate alpha-N-acetylglucosaminyl 1-phosphate transferase [Candidatus Competibacteraceae bacterium]|nr:undecaprenyl/decaprenyl-phosphate alpha-N-acetylglucosaminyl 1-phosphate transferase [Candidatus Competibacteraceae bacterium]MBK7984645.1 undecaprenyl/decaprenyl-phosphate alpha-N-acetylglucosaminyl 1-phosphate transferase [Candidatus Competibacteraceae bacterium]MBK8897107.1 undecaprenyl/decaprenyl-phosphate alpha-N-acetylglucosaminyl 1-phosphate transferase [Candidatus Competibacteraceae bacterium]
MALLVTSLLALFTLSLAISWIVIGVGIPLSHYFNIADHPGGHKEHDTITPFIGGTGIFFAIIIGLNIIDGSHLLSNIPYACMILSAITIFLTGFADDVLHLDYKIRFLAQTIVALVMALWGGVILLDLGKVFFSDVLELNTIALPFTVFATIGVINALNMIDGLDGLAGSLSFVSLLLIAIVTFVAGEEAYLGLVVTMMGGVSGFLYYNLRYGSRRRAAVFLGDNGSMLLGLLFSWLFIHLSQGETRAMTPVTALWILAVPLMDAVGVMIRRLYYRNSPFYPDRNHLHHLLVRASFRTQDIVYIISLIQLVLGSIGLAGLYLNIPEFWMLAGFTGVFLVYCYIIARPWRFVLFLRSLHARMGFTSADCHGVFVGNFPMKDTPSFVHTLVGELHSNYDYDVRIYEDHANTNEPLAYAVIELFLERDDMSSASQIRPLITSLKKQLQDYTGIRIRQFIKRDDQHDRRIGHKPVSADFRNTDRRSKSKSALIYRACSDGSVATPHYPLTRPMFR